MKKLCSTKNGQENQRGERKVKMAHKEKVRAFIEC